MNRTPLASLSEDLNLRHPSDWKVLVERLETAIQTGEARRIAKPWQMYERDEEWFLDMLTGETYLYLPPGDKSFPEWRRVDPFSGPPEKELQPKSINDNGLRAIPAGMMSRVEGEGLKYLLGRLAGQHGIEAVVPRTSRSNGADNVWVSTFRDIQTDTLYELVEYPNGDRYSWGPVFPSEKDELHPHVQ